MFRRAKALVGLDIGSSAVKAVELKPDFVEAYYFMGIVLGEADRIHEARKCFLTALELAQRQNKSDMVKSIKANIQLCNTKLDE